LLLTEGKTFRSHRGAVALIHRDYVRTGRLPVDIGRILNTLSNLRSVGDYGGATHVSRAEANGALIEAQQFLEAVRALLPAGIRNIAPESTANSEVEEHGR
jgi:uncharacterized protein (UPF0332 family)